ncbi:MAG: hypothetical protein WCV92_00130 [Candidatus Buchananbacteria bacterium]
MIRSGEQKHELTPKSGVNITARRGGKTRIENAVLINWGPPHFNESLYPFTIHCQKDGSDIWAVVEKEGDLEIVSEPIRLKVTRKK